ncbi:aminotransferase class V-fold PLP-dependent enzyme [Helcococcus ovis]|uniref:aminotransferase class V-fold PLP-dependent enzyme n=1 Tax=Helcococcus ovis TaxID=72026 RepID=UPI0010702103|nr:SufS family cysteine desulfurase [Helcococcus ovis]TFF67434.1 SufS family cysteine desulfurase [Helcococcus ovis]WNZ01556.1 SufS family cysteine desulfurase [Helcococcus ovis]
MKTSKVKNLFPFFTNEYNKPLVYLDSAATTQKPKIVIDSLKEYYEIYNANANRGGYKSAIKSSQILEYTREIVQKYINASKSEEVIFTKSATEGLNLISKSYGLNNLKPGDEILISIAEHHANLITWQKVAKKTGAKLVYFYLTDNYELDIEDFKMKINENTKIVSVTAASNVIPFKVPIKEIIDIAHEKGAIVVIDAAQIVSHSKIDVQALNCDFLVFSGHKMYSAQGVGVVYGKYDLLKSMEPFLLGGDMIEYVYEQDVLYADLPTKFEAGTLDVAAIYSLNKAIDFIDLVGMETINAIENEIFNYALEELKKLDFIELYLPEKTKNGNLIAFNVKNIHPHDVSQILDFYNIAIRVGHHCAQPLHRYLGINSSCRISFACYNSTEDIDKFIQGLYRVKEIFYGN